MKNKRERLLLAGIISCKPLPKRELVQQLKHDKTRVTQADLAEALGCSPVLLKANAAKLKLVPDIVAFRAKWPKAADLYADLAPGAVWSGKAKKTKPAPEMPPPKKEPAAADPANVADKFMARKIGPTAVAEGAYGSDEEAIARTGHTTRGVNAAAKLRKEKLARFIAKHNDGGSMDIPPFLVVLPEDADERKAYAEAYAKAHPAAPMAPMEASAANKSPQDIAAAEAIRAELEGRKATRKQVRKARRKARDEGYAPGMKWDPKISSWVSPQKGANMIAQKSNHPPVMGKQTGDDTMATKSKKKTVTAAKSKPAKQKEPAKALTPAETMFASFGVRDAGPRGKLLHKLVDNVGKSTDAKALATYGFGKQDLGALRAVVRRFTAKIDKYKLKLTLKHDAEKDTYGLFRKA